MSKRPNEKSGSVNRRSFIRGLGASSGIATGLTGVATARASNGENRIDEEFVEKAKEHLEQREKLQAKYDETEQVRTALKETGGGLLEKLSAEGISRVAPSTTCNWNRRSIRTPYSRGKRVRVWQSPSWGSAIH